MESDDYRDNLESLLRYFNKHWVYPTEIGGYLGVDYRTVERKFGISRNGCSVETLARKLSNAKRTV